MEYRYNNYSVFETKDNYKVYYFSLKFPDKVVTCNADRTHYLIVKFDNHFLVIPSILLFYKKRETLKPLAKLLHHSVNFYFTVLSVPSQDSSLGQFLFYRPVSTVTGLIFDEGKHFCFQQYYMHKSTYYQYIKLLNFYKTTYYRFLLQNISLYS